MALKANKITFILLKIAISAALLYFVFTKTGIARVFTALREISISSFISAVVLYIIAQIISTLRWKLLLPGGIKMRKLFSLYMIGCFFNNFLPGLIGGDAVKGYYLYQETGKGSLVFASIFMDRYIGFAVLIAICAFAFPFGYAYLHGTKIEWLLPLIILSFTAGSLLVFGLRLGQKIKRVSDFYNYFSAYRSQRAVIGKTLVLSVFVQFAGILGVYVLSIGLGQNIPFLAFLIYLPLIILISMIPISVSGLGVREGAFVLFFGFIGVKPETATAMSLSWFMAFSVGSLIGLVEYLKYKKEIINVG